MNNHSLFYEIIRIYGRTALRLIRRHERCSRKLARYTNHLTFLTRCIKNRVVPKDLRVRPPGERIRLTQKAKGDAKKEIESTAQSITSTLSTNDANRILEQIETNTQRVFNTTKDRHKQKFEKLIREKQAAVSPVDTPYVDKTNWVINLSSRSLSRYNPAEERTQLRRNSCEYSWHRDHRQGRNSRKTTRRRTSRYCEKSC